MTTGPQEGRGDRDYGIEGGSPLAPEGASPWARAEAPRRDRDGALCAVGQDAPLAGLLLMSEFGRSLHVGAASLEALA